MNGIIELFLSSRTRCNISRNQVVADASHNSNAIEQWDLLDRLLGELDDVEWLVCAHLDGMSNTEIALSTGWSRQTIHRKLRSICVTARRLEHRPRLARAA